MTPPLSPRSRTRKHREKLKSDAIKYRLVKEKDKERKRKERAKEKEMGNIDKAKQATQRMKNRQRVAAHRRRQKEAKLKQQCEDELYKNNQSFGKAVARVSRSLPQSPRKKKIVISQLAQNIGIISQKSSSLSKNKVSKETENMIHEYYCHDDISRQAPGKRDHATVWKSDGKERLQKRHLYLSLGEAFALFVEEYPSIQIGKSKIAELRPANVLLQKDTPKEACLCVYHENIVLLCEALHQAPPEFPLFTSRFVNNFVCSSSLESCMFGSCKECKGKTN